MAYFAFSVLALAALLFFPASKLIWVLSVRRLQRKLGRALDQTEIQGQLRRARVIAVLVCLPFSYLFTLSLVGMPGHG